MSIGRIVSDGIAGIVEGISVAAGEILGTSMGDYSILETSDSSDVMVASDGSLLSAFRIDGTTLAIGVAEFEDACSSFSRMLRSGLVESGHVIQFWFMRDPSASQNTLSESLASSRAACKNMSLDVGDILDSKIEHLSKFCSEEKYIIGVWTTPSIMTKGELAKESGNKKDALKKVGRMAPGGQNLLAGIKSIRDRHASFIDSIESDLKSSSFVVQRLTTHEIVACARNSIDPEFTRADWRPTLPGDKLPKFQRGNREFDQSDLQYPPISWQIFPRDGRRIGASYFELGDKVYAPLFIEIPAIEITPFSYLLDKLSETDIPWRISFLVEGGGISTVGFKSMMASILIWASQYNRQIDEAVAASRAAIKEGEPVVRLKISICTWAPKGRLDLLQNRASRLAKFVSGWGQCEVREVSGDPAAGFMSSTCLTSYKSIANASVGTFYDIVRMLPYRSASPWRSGGVLFRTLDGKLMPFQPGSSLQTTWTYLFFARPGFGKSVLMSAINLASCMQPGLKRLPRIVYIDIGPSSRGFIQVLRDALPEEQKHQAAHFRMRMNREFAINPCDTQLGMRSPLPSEKSFLVDFLTLLATPAEMSEPYPSMSSLVSKVVDEMYVSCSDSETGKPNKYSRGTSVAIDAVLDDSTFSVDSETSWWEVVDYLFENDQIHEATMAQRYAVPKVSDAASAARSPSISDLYKGVKIETGESLNEAFGRLISESVKDYPVLSCETKFDIGDTRVASIDLDEVAKSGGASANRQTAVMYMLARTLAKDFRLHPEDVKDMHKKYKVYHAERIKLISEDMKWICLDEFHRTSSSKSIRNQVLVDMREGRKWNLGVMLASQSVDDFPEEMKEFATGVFVLNAGTSKNSEDLKRLFGFNETSRQMLMDYAHGPTARGAPFLAQLATKSGSVSQLMVSTISPIENWAFSTTAEDVLIREGVCAKIGMKAGRVALAEAFPGGSAKKVVERIREAAGSDLSGGEDGAILSVINSVLLKHGKNFDTSG